MKSNFKQFMETEWQYYKYYYHSTRQKPYYIRFAIEFYWETFLMSVRDKICKKKGHKWVDDGSYANEESGAVYFVCERCGKTAHHIYY